MNIPKDYDNEAERLLTYPNLLPKQDIPGTMPETDRAVLMKTIKKNMLRPVSFAQEKTHKTIGTDTKLMSQREKK